MGDHKGGSLAAGAVDVVLEGIPAVIDVPASAALHIAVRRAVPLDLGTGEEVVDAGVEGEFLGRGQRLDVAQVAVGERVDTDGRHDGVGVGAGGVVLGEDVHGREETADVGARLVLVGPGQTEHVVGVAEAGVELGGHGGEVLLLEVARGLIEEGGRSLAAGGVAVEGNRLAGRGDEGGVGSADRGHRRARRVGTEGVGVAETDVETVVGVDVPVDAGQDLVVRGLEGVALVAARVVAELGIQELLHFIHLGHGRVVAGNVAAPLLGSARTGDAGRTGDGVEGVLAVEEEEELVLDDGTADGRADGVVERLGLGNFLTGHVVAAEFLGGVVIVGAGVELVRAGLGHGVDRTALETALAHVEGRDVDRHLLDRVEGDRGAAGRQVGADTEGVVERGAVNGHRRTAVVAAADREAAARGGGLRSQEHDVVHAAGDRRDGVQLPGADVRRGTVALAAEAGGVGDDDGALELLRVVGQAGVEGELLAELEGDVVVDLTLVAEAGDFDRVGTAGAEAVDRVAAVGIGHGAVDGAGGDVGRDDGHADDGFTLRIDDTSAEGGGGHLGRGDRARNHGSDCKQENFEKLFH